MRKKSSENVRELKRRLETQKKKNIMNTICKFLCSAAGLALIPAAGAFAQSAADYDSRGPWAPPESGNAAYGNDDYAYNPEAVEASSGSHAIAVKAFYALGLEAPDKMFDSYSDPEVDLGGLTFEYAYDFSAARGPVSAELIFAASVGYGSVDYTGYYAGYYYGSFDAEVELLSFDLETGLNLSLNAGERFSLFFGPRVGLNLLYVSETVETSWTRIKDDETEAGLLYGGDVGFTIKFTDHSGLTATVGYRASTAQPLEIEEQSWVRFSIGYKHTF